MDLSSSSSTSSNEETNKVFERFTESKRKLSLRNSNYYSKSNNRKSKIKPLVKNHYPVTNTYDIQEPNQTNICNEHSLMGKDYKLKHK